MTRIRQRRLDSPASIPEVPVAELAWLAGIIDGEGSVALSHGGTRSPHLRVQVTNGSDAILQKLRSVFALAGMEAGEYRESRGTTNMVITQADSLVLHRLIRPYLVRQVEQYDAAVAFLRRRYDEGRLRVQWTDEERAEWDAMRRRFHKRGVHH